MAIITIIYEICGLIFALWLLNYIFVSQKYLSAQDILFAIILGIIVGFWGLLGVIISQSKNWIVIGKKYD